MITPEMQQHMMMNQLIWGPLMYDIQMQDLRAAARRRSAQSNVARPSRSRSIIPPRCKCSDRWASLRGARSKPGPAAGRKAQTCEAERRSERGGASEPAAGISGSATDRARRDGRGRGRQS